MPEPEGGADPCCVRCEPLSLLSVLLTFRRYRSGDGFARVEGLGDDVEVEVGKVKSRDGTLVKSSDKALLRVGGRLKDCCCFWYDILGCVGAKGWDCADRAACA